MYQLMDILSDNIRPVGIAQQIQASFIAEGTSVFHINAENGLSCRIKYKPQVLSAFCERGVGRVKLTVFQLGILDGLASAKLEIPDENNDCRNCPQNIHSSLIVESEYAPLLMLDSEKHKQDR